MVATLRVPTLLIIGSLSLGTLSLAGCAGGSFLSVGEDSTVTTSSVPAKPKIDPACVTLAAQIDSLRQAGVEDKVNKAAARKYKLQRADLNKVNELTKANAEFQARCSTLPQAASINGPTTGVATAASAAGGQVAARQTATTAKAAVQATPGAAAVVKSAQ